MESVQLVLVVILGLVGMAIAFFLLRLLCLSLANGYRQMRESIILKNSLRRLERIDQLLADHSYRNALTELRRAVVFDIISREHFIAALREHHQNILSRYLIVAEHISQTPENIGILERLFIERAELLSLFQRARAAYQRLLDRREKVGKEIPSWSKEDFERKAADIRKELDRNRTQLKEELDRLFNSITSVSKEGIVYH